MKPNGILLAAGRGRRMGGNKQFHPVRSPEGEKPLVAAAFDTIAAACEKMFVVLGHRAEEVAAALGERRFEIVSVDPDLQMVESIRAGLEFALSRTSTRSGILLQLGDHPSLGSKTLDQILAVSAEHSDKAIMPTFRGAGGHPVLIPSAIAEKILATPCPNGLRQFWLEHADLCMRFEVGDPGVVRDVDTPPA